MSQVVTTPYPKIRYQAPKDAVTTHRDLVASAVFERAIDFALLQYAAELSNADLNLNAMAGVALRQRGAQEFVRVLRNLAESQTITSVRVDDNLQHDLK